MYLDIPQKVTKKNKQSSVNNSIKFQNPLLEGFSGLVLSNKNYFLQRLKSVVKVSIVLKPALE